MQRNQMMPMAPQQGMPMGPAPGPAPMAGPAPAPITPEGEGGIPDSPFAEMPREELEMLALELLDRVQELEMEVQAEGVGPVEPPMPEAPAMGPMPEEPMF